MQLWLLLHTLFLEGLSELPPPLGTEMTSGGYPALIKMPTPLQKKKQKKNRLPSPFLAWKCLMFGRKPTVSSSAAGLPWLPHPTWVSQSPLSGMEAAPARAYTDCWQDGTVLAEPTHSIWGKKPLGLRQEFSSTFLQRPMRGISDRDISVLCVPQVPKSHISCTKMKSATYLNPHILLENICLATTLFLGSSYRIKILIENSIDSGLKIS